MTRGRRQRVVTAALWALAVQLLAGGWIVLHAQHDVSPTTIVEQRISDDVSAIESRVRRLEDLHLEGRLAVLDALNDRSWRVELLVIGLFLTTAGHLFLQAWQHRWRGEYRHGRFNDTDDTK